MQRYSCTLLERAVRKRLPGPCFIKTENKDREDRRGDEPVKDDDQISLHS